MSILNRPEQRPEMPPKEEMIAQRLKRQTVETYKGLLGFYVEGLKTFWKNPSVSPQKISQALGADAAEIFSLHYKLGEFLYQFNPNEVTEAKKMIGEFVVNSDGTVTVPENTEETNG